jgi:hypothetical protein
MSTAKQQAGNAERSAQLKAVATDYLVGRCYSLPSAPVKGIAIPGLNLVSLHSSCIYGSGWYGFIAVKSNEPTVIEVFTQKELNAQLSIIKEGK